MNVVGQLEIFNSTFHWKIENFSGIDAAIGVRVFSPLFSTTHPRAKKLQWQLVFYPGGYDEESKDYMGLCLSYSSECEVSASYTFSILDEQHNKITELAPGNDYLYKRNQNWGMKRFCKKKLIHGETRHALINDTIIISCAITVKSTTLDDEHYDAEDIAKAHFEKLLESGELSDVTFEVEKKQIQLHKGIVTSLSPVFFAMFQHKMKEGERGVVEITDVKYDIMKELFRYIYVRKVNDIENIAGDLLVAADKYDVEGLKISCENILSANLNVDNALQHLELAVKHNTTHLKSKAIEFVVSRLEAFVDKPEFQQMDGSYKDELFRAIAKNKVKNVT